MLIILYPGIITNIYNYPTVPRAPLGTDVLSVPQDKPELTNRLEY